MLAAMKTFAARETASGVSIEFDVAQGPKGLQAENVRGI